MFKRRAAVDQIKSRTIRRATEIAIAGGNSIKEIQRSWSKAREVVAMKLVLSNQTREEISTELSSLRYFSREKTPHYSAEEGFFSDDEKAGISFPR